MNAWLLLSLCLVVAATPLFEVQNVDVADDNAYYKPVLVQIASDADSRDLVQVLEPHGLVPASSDDVPERQVVLMPYGKALERADFLDFVFPSLAALLNLLLTSVFKLPWIVLSAFSLSTSNSTDAAPAASTRAERSLPFDMEPTLDQLDAYPSSYEIDYPPSFFQINNLYRLEPFSDSVDYPPESTLTDN